MSTSGGVFTWISAKNDMQINWAIRYILRNDSNYIHFLPTQTLSRLEKALKTIAIVENLLGE